MKNKKYYAYFIPDKEIKGVTDNWEECKTIVSGITEAKFKGFVTKGEAERWLEAGADYRIKHIAFEKGVYFDAGTGGGKGVEISVTDEKGKSLLDLVVKKNNLNHRGKHWLFDNVTNNYGELMACYYALQIADKLGVKKVFGDSKLVIDFWSRGRIKRDVEEKTIKLAQDVAKLREKFEKDSGSVGYISGGENPADLGFHK